MRALFGEIHRKHYGRINIGDQGKIISYMHLKLLLGVNFNARVLCKRHDRYRSRNTLWNMYICGQELHLPTPCVKDFCTNEVAIRSGSHEEKFWGRTRAQKTSAIACCYYRLEPLRLL